VTETTATRSIYFSSLLIVVATLASYASGAPYVHGADRPSVQRGSLAAVSVPAAEVGSELARLRAEAIAKMKESRAKYEKLLGLYEEEQQRLGQELERRRGLYHQGLISRQEMEPVQQALLTAADNAVEVRRWMAEDEVALAELSLRDEMLRLPAIAKDEYREGTLLIRFNGGGGWSLAEAPKIERLFAEKFGRPLLVSAYGQSPAHDRLRFDHRGAIDIALHPDSSEGRWLLSFLRQLRVPFIAFRGSVPGASTGAHIHIGPPSPRH
jgi:hypothetical protein